MNRPPETNRPPEDEFRDLVQELRRTAPEPPPIHWGAYRAELRDKLERRRAPAPWTWAWSWKSRPLQIAVAVLSAAVPSAAQTSGEQAPRTSESEVRGLERLTPEERAQARVSRRQTL